MKKTTLLVFLLLTCGFLTAQVVSVSPSTFEIDDQITITVNTGNTTDTDCNGLSSPTKLYMHAGIGDANNAFGFDVVGNWGQDDGVGQMVSVGGGVFVISLTPSTYFDITPEQQANVTQMGMVFRNADGTQELKDDGCSDFFIPVGLFQLTLNTPSDAATFVNSGASLPISATTSLAADFTLTANGATIDTQNGITSYSFSPTVTATTSYELTATSNGESQSVKFTAIVAPTVTSQAIPSGIKQGINYHTGDNTKVTLALKAPNKDYVYVVGSFNNYTPSNTYLMKRDTQDTDLFWYEITGLTSNQEYTFQYWVIDETPITDSPRLVKTADPFSEIVLSPFDDPGISSASYPNLPTYPAGQEREVTLIHPGKPAYNWQVQNFDKPKKEDLIIYEVLIRDFDADRNYQDLIDKIDYFKNLNINAIQLMPIMEYDGNESWGYNTAYHMALDKFYGTQDKFKEFVDVCHQNGIAVILDIALNHATGRNPAVRMWMEDPDGDGWGGPSTENPYFNREAHHAYSVFNDFNHQSSLTQYYTRRVVEYWIEEYKIDGFRWDLTKGFTQNCLDNSGGCTDNYQADRVQVLKDYADHSWSIDPTHYVIFEHLGQDNEESEWANYRLTGEQDNIAKGIMMWGKMTTEYTDLVQGFNANISRASHKARGYNQPRLVMYPESHDEERVMYEALTFGNNSNANHNVRNLSVASKRMASMAAVSYMIPGPKMIWHFSELGMDDSIWTCGDGVTVTPGDDGCKLATKPQPQWTENWTSDPDRSGIYDAWARMFGLKINEAVFEGDHVLEGTSQSVRLYVFDNNLPSSDLKNVVILANFRTIDQNMIPDFPYTGTWYNLMDGTPVTVNSTNAPILIPAGEFRIYGNQPYTLSTEDQIIKDPSFVMYPNPAQGQIILNKRTSLVTVYSMIGKEVVRFEGDFQENQSFDISRLQAGMYILKAQTDQGQVIRKFLKN